MHSRFKITGILLLSVYALLLLHNLIPHCHSDEQGHIALLQENGGHHHEHHHHDLDKAERHDHILHSGHFDHSVFDLLVCFLEETEHTASGVEYAAYYHPQTPASLINLVSATKNFALLTSFFSPDFADEQKIDLPFADYSDYQPPPLLSQPARGPPHFS